MQLLIHPSFKTSEHKKFAEKIGEYLNECSYSQEEAPTKEAFLQVYNSLKTTKLIYCLLKTFIDLSLSKWRPIKSIFLSLTL